MVFTSGVVPFHPLQSLTGVFPLSLKAFETKHDINLAHQEKLAAVHDTVSSVIWSENHIFFWAV